MMSAVSSRRLLVDTDRQPPRSMKRSLAATILAITVVAPPMISCAFSPVPLSHRPPPPPGQHASARTRTTCNAKLDRIASSFDLDSILSSEKEFSPSDDDDLTSGKKKNKMKEQMRKQRQEMQQLKKMNRDKKSSSTNDNILRNGRDFDDDTFEVDSRTEYENLIQNISFSAYEIPSSVEGRRIDAVLVELLNNECDDKGQTSLLSISRTQCGTLLSNKCVFVVPPEDAHIFRNALNAHYDNESDATAVPRVLIEQHCSPILRKSHILESQSILLYPTRESLIPTSSSSSSSTLLSNLVPPAEIIAQKIPLDILYEDEHMIVINKQAGIVVHPAAGNWDGTVVNALAYYLMNESPFGLGDLFTNNASDDSDDSGIANNDEMNQNDAVTNSISTLRPGIVHRLDKGTSGVLVVAKTSSALANLSEAFANRKVKKQYLAVAIGNPGADQWINKPIGRHPLHRQKMRVVPGQSTSTGGQARLASDSNAKRGRPALSHIHTIHHDGKLSVVQVEIATGRTHQIRVHLQDHGTPIYGDDVYGLTDWNKALSAQRGITRPLLHAQKLQIEHPVTGESMIFEAKVADDMMEVIASIWPAGEKIEF